MEVKVDMTVEIKLKDGITVKSCDGTTLDLWDGNTYMGAVDARELEAAIKALQWEFAV